jgi:hypothetical protein
MRSVVAALVSTLCLSLSGCGPSADEERADREAEASASAEAQASASAEAAAEAEASASAEAAAEEAAEQAAARKAHRRCDSQMGSLLAALKQIDGRLDVGLTNADLGSRLGDVAVAYNDIPFGRLDPGCVEVVGVPLENAYNEYTTSKNKWDACIEDFGCSVEGAKLSELQEHWAAASRKIGRAGGALSSPEKYMNSTS